MKKQFFRAALIIVLSISSQFTFGQIRLPSIFSNHMILQREAKIPVWGTAQPETQVVVELDGKSVKTQASSDGKWRIHLPAMKAGGPYTMKIYANKKTQADLEFNQILIGDVWLASGQSNMEWQVQQSQHAAVEIKNANYPAIRFFTVPHDKQVSPQDTLAGGSWVNMDTSGVKSASAVAYFFARDIHRELNIPIGIVQSTWGGTPVETWTSKTALLSSAVTRNKVHQSDSLTASYFVQDSLDLIRFWEIVYNPQNKTDQSIPKNDYDDSHWSEQNMPATLKDMINSDYEGIIWLRKQIDIPLAMKGKDLRIELGHPEMNYSLYFNGKEIAKNVWNNSPSHAYKIPAGIVLDGKNMIAVRMSYLWTGGGFNPPAEEMYLSDEHARISLAGRWKYQKDLEPFIPLVKNYHKYPAILYNGMFNPIVSYAIKGVIWYQGEDNAVDPEAYRGSFPLLIADWRTRWKQGNLPFLYVQLANYMKQQTEPSESNWATLREAQTLTLKQPHTGMATAIDIGDPDNIHPKNKQEVGRRLALLAKKIVYKKQVQASGPMYLKHIIEGKKIRITFIETGSGLAIKGGGILTGFAIAGADQKFQWADAAIEGNTVVVSSSGIDLPHDVRFAWADSPECNLINQEGLPAIPFRTDHQKPM